jgi:hypothetical protein
MDQRRPIYIIALLGAALTAVGAFSKAWLTASTSELEIKVGLLGGTACKPGGECQAIELGRMDPNWGYLGIAGVLAAVISMGVVGYVMFLVSKGRAAQIDVKKLAIPPGIGAAAIPAFYLVKPQQATSTISWSPFVAFAGFAMIAGVTWLAKWWLADAQPRRPLPPGWNPNAPGGWQQQPMQQPAYGQQPMHGQHGQPMHGQHGQPMHGQHGQPMHGQHGQPMHGQQPMQIQGVPVPGYGQPQGQGGYAPPQQPVGSGGYAPPVRPIVAMQPNNPNLGPPAPAPPPTEYAPPTRPSQGGYGRPAQPMVQQQSTTIPPGSNPCPKCGTGLAYSSQYGKWYCARCREYL